MKIVLVLVAVAVVLVGVQVVLVARQTPGEGASREDARKEGEKPLMQRAGDLLAPMAPPLDTERLDGSDCGVADGAFTLDGSCDLEVRNGEPRFRKLELFVRRGSVTVQYDPRIDDVKAMDPEPVAENESMFVPVMKEGGRVNVTCADEPCRVEIR